MIGVFVGSGLVAGFTGCVLASKLQIGQANVGLDYLLPALVGAFLGTTTIKPGRVNVLGTIVGVLILAIGISGIQQLGGEFFIEPLFNGTTLVVAIALAGFAQRRRSVTVAKVAKHAAADRLKSPQRAQGSRAASEAANEGGGTRRMSKFACRGRRLLASAGVLAASAAGARAEDDYLTQAKAYIAKVTQPGAPWTGPTTGPKAQGNKLVIYVSQDQRNGGAQGVGDGAQEAAKAIGWDFRMLDGQGSVAQHTSALNEAIALKPDGIILGHDRCQGAVAGGRNTR